MTIDPISISAIIISILGAVTVLIQKSHLSHINICCKCIESDCTNKPETIENEPKITDI